MSKRKTAPAPTPLGNWLRAMAEAADNLKVHGFAATALLEDAMPATCIHDPNSSAARLTLVGSVSQLAHMLQATEHNHRMASLAAQPDMGPR